nr:PIG-L family deacetylase [Geodermatophilaceae bacterium]
RDTYAPGAYNMADHQVTGRAVFDAARDAGNRWVFRDQLVGGLEPWNGVRMVLATGSPRATHGVDIAAHFDAGVASLAAHTAYLEAFGADGPEPTEMLEGFARQAGTRLGVPLATSFELYPVNLL